ncbi:MAG TPA: PadR family transcriptional regulator [Bryobacteraceae bacterium]|nr:PadR family transcriptional regulator [Bryobacteraceae bacterium]
MPPPQVDLLQGTLAMLILKTLALERMHGFGVSVRIRQMTSDVLRVDQGSLYPALHRLERRKLIRAEWGVSENNRKAKFYTLTPKGRRCLEQEASSWVRLSLAVNTVMQAE